MDKIDDIIQRSLESGKMTQAQHDEILLRIQEDGEIDAIEQAQLSKVFSAVQSGIVTIVDSAQTLREEEKNQKEKEARLESKQRSTLEEENSLVLKERVDAAINAGVLSEKEHDEILQLIHSDGKIDEAEKTQMSRLFEARQSGALQISDTASDSAPATSRNRKLRDELTQLALDREDSRYQEPRELPAEPEPAVPEKGELQLPNSAPGIPSIKEAAPIPHETTGEPENDEHSIASFLKRASKRRSTGRAFELHNDRLLDVSLNGRVWTKTGSMVGYYGTVKFTREGILEHGVSKLIKKTMTGEGAMLTKATGQGNIYLADRGKKVSILHLGGHSLVVAGTNLLAFEESVEWDITFMKQLAAMWSGGLFNVRMSGQGDVAVTTFGDPVLLRVSPGEPVMTDVHATVAWSGSLIPQVKTDVAMKTFAGRGSGETLQMRFEGDGFVIIQPFEEIPGDTSDAST